MGLKIAAWRGVALRLDLKDLPKLELDKMVEHSS